MSAYSFNRKPEACAFPAVAHASGLRLDEDHWLRPSDLRSEQGNTRRRKGMEGQKVTRNVVRFRTKPTITLITLAVAVSGCTSQPGSVAQQELESAYGHFLTACKQGDLDAVKQHSSAHWYAAVTNNYVSMGRQFTGERTTQMAEHFPGLDGKSLVRVCQQGPTAGLLYASESAEPDGNDKPRVTFTFIKFTKENDTWKFHGAMEEDREKHQQDGSPTEFDENSLPAHLAIDGRVPEAPAPIAEPDVVGLLDIVSYGYSTEVSINGQLQRVTTDSSSSGVIRGGLRSGENSLRIVVQRTNDEPLETPAITIRAAGEDGKPTEVFKFATENAVGTHSTVFTVEDA